MKKIKPFSDMSAELRINEFILIGLKIRNEVREGYGIHIKIRYLLFQEGKHHVTLCGNVRRQMHYIFILHSSSLNRYIFLLYVTATFKAKTLTNFWWLMAATACDHRWINF